MSELLDKRKFYIDGQWVDPIAANDLEVIDPSTEEAVAVISLGDQADTDAAVAAGLGDQCPNPMRREGVKDVFGHSGPAWELLEQFGLRSDAIIAAVKELV